MDLLRWFAEIRNPVMTAVMSIVTYGGSELFLMGVMCITLWCLDKRFAYRLAFPYFLAGTTVQGLKVICRVPRPWIKDPSFVPVESAVADATGYSFPSGHTFSATILFTGFAHRTARIGWKILWYACIALVMISRMYLGCHTPQDVIVSFAISLAILLVTERLMDKITVNDKNRLAIAAVIAGYTLITMIYSGILYGAGSTDLANTQDVFKTCGAGLGFALCWYVESRWIDFDPRACSLPMQIVKVLIGLAGVLAFKSGLKLIIGESLAASCFRYFCMVVWAMGLFPFIIKKFFSRKA